LISIHAPRGGSDKIRIAVKAKKRRFQSTLPVGGATPRKSTCSVSAWIFQSTLPVGGATLAADDVALVGIISIHAPRGGSDFPQGRPGACNTAYFNPRSPWGERRCVCLGCCDGFEHFNPRSPWGERLQLSRRIIPRPKFQSTLPVGGATYFETMQQLQL